MQVANQEQKESLVGKVLQIVEKYSPNKKWRVDTICTSRARQEDIYGFSVLLDRLLLFWDMNISLYYCYYSYWV